MKLVDEFREIRRVSTPWLLVNTTDYRGVITQLSDVVSKEKVISPLVMWDLSRGHRSLNKEGQTAASCLGTDTASAPVVLLQNALNLPEKSVLFFVCPTQSLVEDPSVLMAAANLRDDFKATGKTLVILGRGIKLPALLECDVPVLNDPLPDQKDLAGIATRICESVQLDPKKMNIDKAAELCQGLSRFAAEESLSRKVTREQFNLKGLEELRRESIELATSRALTFNREKWTFDNVGGLNAFRGYMEKLFSGPKAPSVIVRIDELDKCVPSVGNTAVTDGGVSSDTLKQLLTFLQDRNWSGLLALGGPGTGKTLSSICTGNHFAVPTLALDIGATRNSLVGESERRIRETLEVIYSLGRERVFFIATSNRIETLPPELIARFNCGTWLFDAPGEEERLRIWDIKTKQFGITTNKVLPPSDRWVGRDISNVCSTSWMLNVSLMEAAELVSISGIAARPEIEKLQEMAEKNGFLSANYKGPYKRSKSGNRAITL